MVSAIAEPSMTMSHQIGIQTFCEKERGGARSASKGLRHDALASANALSRNFSTTRYGHSFAKIAACLGAASQ